MSISQFSHEKKISLLLHAIISNTTYAPKERVNGLQRADYEAIGTLSFVQLSQLRHRGAFTAVSQTFETCCTRCAENEDTEISDLPAIWYQVRETERLIWKYAIADILVGIVEINTASSF